MENFGPQYYSYLSILRQIVSEWHVLYPNLSQDNSTNSGWKFKWPAWEFQRWLINGKEKVIDKWIQRKSGKLILEYGDR